MNKPKFKIDQIVRVKSDYRCKGIDGKYKPGTVFKIKYFELKSGINGNIYWPYKQKGIAEYVGIYEKDLLPNGKMSNKDIYQLNG